ncbi:MAG TPA: acetyl-CoA hydrolase/transferase C-terminal domain-containing protein [Burkholderiales bacterium]|jgi:acetyl-CoA hydrolase|nr:acetyl-CoA hydrolase/transferase C-terminal domain-containing protein [Burkholderiales bacterium]
MRPDLTGIVRAGDGIVIGQACAEPQTLAEALVDQRAAFSGARVFLGVNYSGIVRPGHADHLRLSAYCGSGHNRALADAGVLDIHPHPYSRLGALIREGKIPCDVVLVQVSPPNSRGEYSLGLAADYLVPALSTARSVVAEVNDKVPWTHTERVLKANDLTLVVQSSRDPAPAPVSKSGEVEKRIAQNAAAFVPDGATLEFGLGALPDAICAELGGRKGLAVHSGTIGDGVADLLASGSADAVTAAMLIGTRKLFEAARENPRIRLRSVEHTHDPRVLAGIERFVAVNSAIEVDLTGQVNAEVARGSYLGAVGGALDFVRAANQSRGGVSLTLIPAARIVENLSGPVATPRSETGVVVTELGAADLRGCSLNERKKKLKAISKP